jgi:hypothetical protein
MSFGLLSYLFPLFPLLRPLFPVLHSHLSQVIAVASLIIQIRQHSQVRVPIVPHLMYGNLNQCLRFRFFFYFSIVTNPETGG